MGKPRMIGMNSAYIPNAKADMRYRKAACQRGQEITEKGSREIRLQRREVKELKRMKQEKCKC